jgi:2-oxoglutarate dehydrogenase E2 component (dihydrolipoamide succinyltransferase)
LARDRGIDLDELKQIEGSGQSGAITREDLNTYIRDGRPFREVAEIAEEAQEEKQIQPVKPEKDEISAGPGEEIIEMSRTRRLIAEHMVRSKQTSPHVTSMVELDVTNVVQWRESNKELFREKHGVKLTYTPLVIEAVVKALKLFPDVNISVKDNYIIRKKYINIGVATALPDGNLIVPVIKEADTRNFVNLAIELSDLAGRARENKLQPAEIKGGTFTITNMGQYDNVSGTPIINQPEAAILAVGAIKKKPAVVDVDGKQTIGIRDILILSLTYDHRVIDGALGGSFVRSIGEKLVNELPEF